MLEKNDGFGFPTSPPDTFPLLDAPMVPDPAETGKAGDVAHLEIA